MRLKLQFYGLIRNEMEKPPIIQLLSLRIINTNYIILFNVENNMDIEKNKNKWRNFMLIKILSLNRNVAKQSKFW